MRTDNGTQMRVLQDFEGRWHLERHILSTQGPDARFEGRAVWSRTDGGLLYLEEGQMTLEGHPPMHAERRFFWAEDLSVFFEDGRFFHRVPGQGGDTAHWCDPDSYTLHYAFREWPVFHVHWRVSGPRKDYQARTQYTRL